MSARSSVVCTPKDVNSTKMNAYLSNDMNQSVCRICFKVIDMEKDLFYGLNSTSIESSLQGIRQKFALCVPEVALNIIANSYICSLCITALNSAFEFREKCLKAERIIYDFIINKVVGDIEHVDLEEVLKWNNDKVTNKLECVDVLDDCWDLSACTDVSYICSGNVEDIEIKDEPLHDEQVNESTSEIKADFVNFFNDTDVEVKVKNEIQIKQEPHFINTDIINEATTSTTYNDIKYFKLDPTKSPLPHLETQDSKALHTCDKCFKQFTLKCDYRLHKLQDKDYSCDECEFIASDMKILRKHLLVSHTKERAIKCKLCNLSITDLDNHDMQLCNKRKLNLGVSTRKRKSQNSSCNTTPTNLYKTNTSLVNL